MLLKKAVGNGLILYYSQCIVMRNALQSGGGQQQDHIIWENLVEDVSGGVEVACEELNQKMQCFLVEVDVAFFFKFFFISTSPFCHVIATWTTQLDSQLNYGF